VLPENKKITIFKMKQVAFKFQWKKHKTITKNLRLLKKHVQAILHYWQRHVFHTRPTTPQIFQLELKSELETDKVTKCLKISKLTCWELILHCWRFSWLGARA
jgi:hypothetical protein